MTSLRPDSGVAGRLEERGSGVKCRRLSSKMFLGVPLNSSTII